MDPLQRLAMVAACRDLIVRGCAAVHTPDPDAFAALFVQDGVLERPGGSALIGREATASPTPVGRPTGSRATW